MGCSVVFVCLDSGHSPQSLRAVSVGDLGNPTDEICPEFEEGAEGLFGDSVI